MPLAPLALVIMPLLTAVADVLMPLVVVAASLKAKLTVPPVVLRVMPAIVRRRSWGVVASLVKVIEFAPALTIKVLMVWALAAELLPWRSRLIVNAGANSI